MSGGIDSLLFALKARDRWFGVETFFTLFQAGWIVDGRDGGLVVGRRHAAGNIYMIVQREDKFFFHSNMEGGEYLVNHRASTRHMERLKQLNTDTAPEEPGVELLSVSPSTRVLNLHAQPFDKLLLIDERGQFIVNRGSTRKHLVELERLNSDVSDFRYCDPEQMKPKGDDSIA